MSETATLPLDVRPGEIGVIRPEREPPSLLAVIARAASDPSVNVEKMAALLAMHRELAAEKARSTYFAAMNAAQAEIQPVVKTVENIQTKSFYAKLEHVDAAIRPIYLRHGFSLSYDTVAPLAPGNIRISCLCAHVDGHAERYGREAPADTLGPKGSAVKTILHGGASTETFLKRYLECGIFNVVLKGMDDDGVLGGSQPITEEQVKTIADLIAWTNSNLDKFLAFMGAATIADIQEKDFARAVNILERKKKQESQQ